MGGLHKCVQCGGNWNNSTNAGVWNRNLNNNRTNSNNNTGFSADYASLKKTSKCWRHIVEHRD